VLTGQFREDRGGAIAVLAMAAAAGRGLFLAFRRIAGSLS
jgi:hypothetical protein